jgi:LPS-assembly protein
VAAPVSTTADQDQTQAPVNLPAGVDPTMDPAFAPPPDPADSQPPQTIEPEVQPPAQPAIHEADITPQPGDDPALAYPIPAPPAGVPVHIEADTQLKTGDVYTLDGHVVIDYKTYIVHADHATYDSGSSQVDARGHVTVDGGPSDEHMVADHGTMNLDAHTAHFYDVTGTLGVRAITHDRYVFTAPNPFAINGDELIELGPGRYQVIHGTMTSCRLPNPDWKLLSRTILIDNGKASAKNSFFALADVPFLYLPYVTHPTEKNQRQSGFLLPIFGNDTTKGLILGEQVYLVFGRSADLAFGAQYYSRRGFAPQGQFRYRGAGDDFGYVRFRSLLDRLPEATNQGGTDIVANGRRDLTPEARAVASVEYLSSYIYRQAFEENYSAAINSEVRSQAYLTEQHDGYAATGLFERYQTFRSDNTGDEIRVLHTPELDLDALDRPLAGTRLLWGGEAAAAAMSRSEPGFVTSSFIPRVDLYPHIALPLSAGGWTLRSEAGLRETYYGRSQNPGPLGQIPTQRDASLNRTAFTGEISLRPPAVERDFDAPFLRRWLGADLRHSIEPEFRYRFVTGINNYQSVLRFDQTDILSNTNELEYGLTQHLFLRHVHPQPCKGDEAMGPTVYCGGGTVDWITWTVAQKAFFDKNFGGALSPGARNVLATTLDFSGIAYLTRPRETSPVISRLRVRTTSATDFEWDIDYDARRGRLLSSNALLSYRMGPTYLSAGNYRLHTLGANPSDVTVTPSTTPGAVSDFNQLRLAAIYGSPTRHGFSGGFNMGYDFKAGQTQYASAETGYNRDCCGLTFEIRRYSLGSVRDDTQYLFSFTLAGVGTAGNLNRMVRVF